MIKKIKAEEEKNTDLYLKYVVMEVDGKAYRKFKLNYHQEAGRGILDSMLELKGKALQKDKEGEELTDKTIHELTSGEEGIGDQFFGIPVPEGRLSMHGVYAGNWAEKNTTFSLKESRKNSTTDLTFYLIDFTGVGDSEMSGYYHYNWKENSARLDFNSIPATFFTTLLAILLHYHKSFFHLITEINMYQATYEESSVTINQQTQPRRAY